MRYPKHSASGYYGVDVEGQDGLRFHGVVTDTNGPDLVIDLQTNPSSRITVPCGQAFHGALMLTDLLVGEYDEDGERVYRDEESYIENLVKRHSEIIVLMQISDDRPWTWYPGALLAVCRFGFAIVQLENSNVWSGRFAVPCDHVRFAGDSGIAITNGLFDKWRLPEATVNQISTAQSADDVHASGVDFINKMPVEIMQKIFGFLDTYQQTQIRSVCQKWYHFLPLCMTTNRKTLWINITGPRFRGDMDFIRKFGACLVKYYIQGVEAVILSGDMIHQHKWGGPGSGDPVENADVLVAVASAMKTVKTALNLPVIKRLVLSGCTLQPSAFFSAKDGISSDLRAVCETIVFDGAAMAFAGENVEVLGGIKLHGQVDLRAPEYNEKFWEILDAAVPTLSPDDVNGVQMWLEHLYHDEPDDEDNYSFTKRYTRQSVVMYQGLDPRPGAFHIEDFEDPRLFADLSTFHKLTMIMLRRRSRLPIDD